MSSDVEKSDGGIAQPTVRGALLAILIGFLILAGLAEIVARIAMPQWRDFYSGRFMRVVDVPGYGSVATGLPGFDGFFAQNNGDFRVRISLNDHGLRNPEPIRASKGRVWVVGDSMAFGWGVEYQQIYSTVSAALAGNRTYNVASPGTGVCGYHALVARMPSDVKPTAIIVGLVLENDIHIYRCLRGTAKATGKSTDEGPASSWALIDAKRFLTAHSGLYNFLAVALKRVPTVNRALAAFGLVAPVHHYHSQITENDAKSASASTADEIGYLRRLAGSDIPFAVLIAPARFELRDKDPFYTKLRKTVVRDLEDRGITVIDPVAAFRAAGFAPTHFAHDGHWSAAGHQIAGKAVARWLQQMLPKP